jgi:hypothetical protein
MTEQHRATPEQWEWKNGETYIVSEAIIHPSGADSLVERVAMAISTGLPPCDATYTTEARAAIREVAAWLDERDLKIQNDPDCPEAPFADDAIRWLRDEASR